MSTRQYARLDTRLVRERIIGIALQAEDYGTHPLRRTKTSIVYEATGDLHAVRILLGRAKIESIVRYLGVDVEDALELSERTQVRPDRLDARAAFQSRYSASRRQTLVHITGLSDEARQARR